MYTMSSNQNRVINNNPVNPAASVIDNNQTLGMRTLRKRRLRRKRNANRICQRDIQLNASINNEYTLNLIKNLPRQITNDPLLNQFFNGCTFI
jgi:hypothetical protein